MNEQELKERLKVVECGRSWIGTRYRHRLSKKGAGVDCVFHIFRSFQEAGLVGMHDDIGRYHTDWHMHRDEERYLSGVSRYMRYIDPMSCPTSHRTAESLPLPGDVVLWKVGKTFSHGGIATEWPYVVHASLPDRCVLEVSVMGTILENLPMKRCSFWG